MRQKSQFEIGMNTILNNPQASFLKNPAVFNEIQQQSQMPISQMIRHIGKTKKSEPTEKEKSQARLNNLESKINK
jgi:hypothetical protein